MHVDISAAPTAQRRRAVKKPVSGDGPGEHVDGEDQVIRIRGGAEQDSLQGTRMSGGTWWTGGEQQPQSRALLRLRGFSRVVMAMLWVAHPGSDGTKTGPFK